MKWLVSAFGLSIALFLPACDIGYATFVTSTDIGISADVKTEDLHIGYVRTELFVGPGYPQYGETPEVVGFLGSNLSAFSPKIKQLYATGDAAGLVTQYKEPDTEAAKPEPYVGERRPLVFGTGTNLGLKIGFTGNAPSSAKFGYNREELSIVPLRSAVPGEQTPDKYASVLASIDMDEESTTLPQTSLRLTQFVATGAASRNLAKRPEIRRSFAQEAESKVKGALSGTFSYDDSSKTIEAFWMPDGKTINKDHSQKIQSCMDRNQIAGSIPYLINAQSRVDRDKVISCLNI